MQRGLGSEEGYARYAAQYDEKLAFFDSFEKQHLQPYINMAKGLKVLDAGAGTGRITTRIADAGADVTALDVSAEMLDILKTKNGNIETVVSDAENMPFEDGSFDMVFSSLMLVHLKKIEPFMDEVYRVLKDDGLFVLTNIHYRKPMILRDGKGKYTIRGYNHFPRHVTDAANKLAYGIEEEIMVYEGDDVWVSQILVLKK